jgi:type 1 fimbriae regulatory protein FimB/type 1 fimbriae regulatory protein FimE
MEVLPMSPDTIQVVESGKVEQRTYLTANEVGSLIDGALLCGRYGRRDALIIMMLYRHGLRTQELVDLRWDNVHFDRALLLVERCKNGDDSSQPIKGDELRFLRNLKASAKSVFVFETERGGQMTTRNVRHVIARAAKATNIEINVHAHMLRHACGYNLANQGTDTRAIQGYLGHKNIKHTVIYTKLAENRFKGFDKLF